MAYGAFPQSAPRGSGTDSLLVAGYKFVDRLIQAAFEGKTGIVEPSYVYIKSDIAGAAAAKASIGDLEYFSLPVELGVSLPSHHSTPSALLCATTLAKNRR